MAKRIREKTAARKANADKRPCAHVTNIGYSSSKVCLVLDLVRGKKVEDAVAILRGTTNASAVVVRKLIESAVANAENNQNLDKNSLYVAEIYTTQGPTLKRINIRARGRADRVLKRTSNITVILDKVNA